MIAFLFLCALFSCYNNAVSSLGELNIAYPRYDMLFLWIRTFISLELIRLVISFESFRNHLVAQPIDYPLWAFFLYLELFFYGRVKQSKGKRLLSL